MKAFVYNYHNMLVVSISYGAVHYSQHAGGIDGLVAVLMHAQLY